MRAIEDEKVQTLYKERFSARGRLFEREGMLQLRPILVLLMA